MIRSEVALSTEQQADRVLVLQIVGSARLRGARSGRQNQRASVLLVEVEPSHVRREGQVLDRSPAGDQADHTQSEVGVAVRHAGGSRQSGDSTADQSSTAIAVLELAVGTVDRGVP